VADSAGYAGQIIGEPIHSWFGMIGAALTLAAIGVAGILVITRTTIRSVAERTAAGVVAGARPVGRAARSLFELEGDPAVTAAPGHETDDPELTVGGALAEPEVYDQ